MDEGNHVVRAGLAGGTEAKVGGHECERGVDKDGRCVSGQEERKP